MSKAAPELQRTPIPGIFQKGLERINPDFSPNLPVVIPHILSSQRSIELAADILRPINKEPKISLLRIEREQEYSPKSTLKALLKTGVDAMQKVSYRVRGRGRGPCPGCIAGTEENHHGGSKCTKRGQKQSFNLVTTGNLPAQTQTGRIRRQGAVL